jgi:hypothetical protein
MIDRVWAPLENQDIATVVRRNEVSNNTFIGYIANKAMDIQDI